MREGDAGTQSEGGEMAGAGGGRAPVTVLGLGKMGSALAGAFLNGGHPTTVWNRSAGKAEALVADGAARAATAAEAVAASPLAVMCVLDYDAVHEVLDPLGDDLSGRVLVNLTTATPGQARRTAAWAAERGAGYLDGAIMAVPEVIARPEALLLYGGPRETFESNQEVLGVLGPSKYLGADAGLAALYDLAMLSGMYGIIGGYLHAAALVGTEGVGAAEILSLLAPLANGVIIEEILPSLAEQIDTGDYAKGAVSNLGPHAVALANLIEASGAQGVDDALMKPIRELVERRMADGHGDGDISGLVELLRR